MVDVQRAARGEGGDERLAVASVAGLRARDTTVTRGEEDGSAAGTELHVRVAERAELNLC